MSPSTVTYKASAMDMLRSGSRIICALGPADFGGIERVRSRLHRLAAAGPAARVGLRVTPASQTWEYKPELVCSDVIATAPIAADSNTGDSNTGAKVRELLVELSATASSEVPVRARLAGDYLLLDLSHGFGDALLPVELFAFLADGSPDPTLPEWAAGRTVRTPLPKALADWMLHNPRKVADVAYGKFRSRKPDSSLPEYEDSTRADVPWTRSPSVAAATSPAGTPSTLRAWRSEHLPDVSVTSILSASVATALTACGIKTAHSVNFLFDCRRYLHTDGIVLGNFAVGIEFHGIDPTSPTELHNSVTHAIDKGRPLAAGALSSMRYLWTRRALPSIGVRTAPESADAKLTFSDVGRVRQLESSAWLDEPGNCVFYPLSEPSLPDSIVVTSLQVRDTFHVTASFHDNFFDRDTVQSALDMALSDPIALLILQELPR